MRLMADVKGTDDGPLVLLLGGGLTGWLSWEPHQARLAAGRRVARVQPLAVELGLEARPLPDGYGIEMESRALAATVEALSPGRPVDLVGWSLGGSIALAFTLDHPDRVRTLALIEPGAMWALPPDDELDEAARRELAEARALAAETATDVTEAQLARLLAVVGMGEAPQSSPHWPLWVRHRLALRHMAPELAHRDRLDRLGTFTRPVLLIKGTGSSRCLHLIVDRLAAALPRAEVLELPGGHAPQLVDMDGFLARLAALHGR